MSKGYTEIRVHLISHIIEGSRIIFRLFHDNLNPIQVDY